MRSCRNTKNSAEEEKRSAAWRSNSFKNTVYALKLSTSLAYMGFKRISLYKRVVEISNKLPKSTIKAEWYK